MLFLLDTAELLIDLAKLVVKILVLINLCFTSNSLLHVSIPCLRNRLSLGNVATTSNLGRLLDRVSIEHIVISLLFELLTFVTNLLLASDHSQIL